MKPNIDCIRGYFKRDPAIEVFDSFGAIARRWRLVSEVQAWRLHAPGSPPLCYLSVAGVPDARYNLRTGTWSTSDKGAVTLLFEFSLDGILTELCRVCRGEEDWRHLHFRASGLRSVTDLVDLLCSAPEKPELIPTRNEYSLAAIIEDILMPFYQVPGQVGAVDEDVASSAVVPCWVALSRVSDLIKKHLEQGDPWLHAVQAEGDGERRESAGSGSDSGRDEASLFNLCESVRTALTDQELLQPLEKAEYVLLRMDGRSSSYSFPFLAPEVRFDDRWHHIPLLCRIAKRHSASFLSTLLKAREGMPLLKAVRSCVWAGCLNPLKQAVVELPARRHQVRDWVEHEIEHHALSTLQEGLTTCVGGRELTFTAHRQQTRMRIMFLDRVFGSKPLDVGEVDRVLNPLPYFFEYPILHWERATDKMAFHNAVSLFQLTTQISCLIAFEELLAWEPSAGLKALLGPDLVEQISGRPSLGSWSRALEVLERHVDKLRVWRRWVETLSGACRERVRLVELRNRISHADFVLDEARVTEAEAEFAAYFGRMLPKLRQAYAGTKTVITRDRKVLSAKAQRCTTRL